MTERSHSNKGFNLKNIRTLLTKSFTDGELRRLCYDNPNFRPVYDQLSSEMGKDKVIDKLIEYADKTERFENLLDLAKEHNPKGYEIYQPYTTLTDSPASPPLPDPSPNPRLRDHIFISYAHEDRPFVDRLGEDLRRRGHIVWLDFEGIKGGEVWRQSIVDGIHASAVMLVVITPKAINSEWVTLEVEKAREFKKPIIPLIVKNLKSPADQITYRRLLTGIQFRNLMGDYDAALPQLLADLPSPQAGLPGYCQKLIARLAEAPWGLDHYIQEQTKLLPIYSSPYDEGLSQTISENLLHRLWHSSRTIVLGEPGVGKSVALERFAWELASNNPPIVPVIINLREYDGAALLEWVRLKLLESDEKPIRDRLQSSEDTKQFLHEMPFTFYLLLDGLNEVRPKYRESAIREIRQMSLAYPGHPIVVTSRIQDESWRELRGGSFDAKTVVIQTITETQAQAFLAAHLKNSEAAVLWQKLDTRMRGLASTPMLLWLIKEAWLETRGRIPGNRGELYANFITHMLRRDDDRKLNKTISRGKRIRALKALALAMHQDEAVSWTRQQVQTVVDKQTLEALLANGLLLGEDVIRFAPHQTVQEHFAARAIKKEVEQAINKPPLAWWQRLASKLERNILDQAANAWWAETFIQLAGITDDPNTLAQKVAEINPWLAWWCVQEGQKVRSDTKRVIQAKSELLVDSDRVQDRRNAVQALLQLPRTRVINHLAKLAFDTAPSVSKPSRQALYELGETGKKIITQTFVSRITSYKPTKRAEYGRQIAEHDPRTGVGTIGSSGGTLPDIDWILIPDDGEWIYQDKKHPGMSSFEISRYPVTYVQFQTFIDDREGFKDRRWWDGLADDEYRHRNQREPAKQAFKFWNHPRERVSWYDAIAFCRWLSWRLGGGYNLDNITAWVVRLPTELEWEKAARGASGQAYPYGKSFDVMKGNTYETGIGQTSAVGLFPQGASPYGVEEMSGNVWEWCLTNYEYPAPNAAKENIRSDARRVLRGGSWKHPQFNARATYRVFNPPILRINTYGFRVCRPPSL
ncbi:MAG: SUMF1/EgtB/PvdO family nonheme iron enzyme [Anaerolineae bacterium]|nr:SUMF1/EgtB/PvdO family nonheme iron enzyme [Anaerolineae bacterium]